MKEDVLEQIVDDFLQHRGYFTMHNIRFRPADTHAEWVGDQDRVYSDVDVVGIDPKRRGVDRVWVVSCKAWQEGFKAGAILRQLQADASARGRAVWKGFRELWSAKWAEAFRARIKELTGQDRFRYSIAVTKLRGDPTGWAIDERIRENLAGNPFTFLTLEEMWTGIMSEATTTPAPSEIGRLAQLLKAAGLDQPRNDS